MTSVDQQSLAKEEEQETAEEMKDKKHSSKSSSLLLNDTEQFTFDFGDDVDYDVASSITEQHNTKSEEEAEVKNGHNAKGITMTKQEKAIKPTRVLTYEEMRSRVANALAHNPRTFLSLPLVASTSATTTISSNNDKKQTISHKQSSLEKESKSVSATKQERPQLVEMTMADAISQFQAGLRRYDENLWLAQKANSNSKSNVYKSKNKNSNNSHEKNKNTKNANERVKRQRVM